MQQLILGIGTAIWWLTEPHCFNNFEHKNHSGKNETLFRFLPCLYNDHWFLQVIQLQMLITAIKLGSLIFTGAGQFTIPPGLEFLRRGHLFVEMKMYNKNKEEIACYKTYITLKT